LQHYFFPPVYDDEVIKMKNTIEKRKWSIILLSLMLVFSLSQSVFAFKDLNSSPAKEQIMELKEAGIIKGVSETNFSPEKQTTYAEAITFIVRAFDINLNHFTFIKQPMASDYYTNIDDHAWYANPFMVAQLNGLEISKDVVANQLITREEFAELLMDAILLKGDYAFIAIFHLIADEEKIAPDKMSSIQKLLITNIVALDAEDKFHPNQPMTRVEVVDWLYKGIQFVKNHQQESNQDPEIKHPEID
jgi:hypothetical protein